MKNRVEVFFNLVVRLPVEAYTDYPARLGPLTAKQTPNPDRDTLSEPVLPNDTGSPSTAKANCPGRRVPQERTA